MNIFKIKFWVIFILIICLFLTMVGCDTKSDDDETLELVEKEIDLDPLTFEQGTEWNEIDEELPGAVEIEFENGATAEAAIEWTEPDEYNPEPEEDTIYDIKGRASAEYEGVIYDDINVEIELTVEGEPPAEANFAVTVNTVTAIAGQAPGEITAEIENTGDLDSEQDIEITIDKEVLNNGENFTKTKEDFEVEGGKTETIAFNIEVNVKQDPGTYEDVITIQSDDDSVDANIEVEIGEVNSIEAANTTITAGAGGTLEVTVTDEYGNIIEDETVEVVDDDGLDGIDTGDIAKTGTDGVAKFSFDEVNADDYEVDFEANGIEDTATVTIKPGPPDESKSYIGTDETLNTEVLNYTDNQSHTFSITVLDEYGNAIENATVTINTVTINLDYTDTKFTFTLSDGTASKTITAADYDSSSTEDQDVAVNLELTGADTDANGKVDVEITAEDGYYDPNVGFDDVTLAVIRVSVDGGVTHAGIDLRNEGYKYLWVN